MLPKVAGSGSQRPRLEQTTASSCTPLLLGPWHPKLSTQPFPALWFPMWYCCLPLLVPSTAHLPGRGSGGQLLDWREGPGHRGGQEGGRTASAAPPPRLPFRHSPSVPKRPHLGEWQCPIVCGHGGWGARLRPEAPGSSAVRCLAGSGWCRLTALLRAVSLVFFFSCLLPALPSLEAPRQHSQHSQHFLCLILLLLCPPQTGDPFGF